MNKNLHKIIANFEEIIAAIFIIITTILVIMNIIMRYILNTGIIWSEEVATGCFVWAVFIGAVACFKRKAHVGVDIVANLLPGLAKTIVNLLVDIALLVINGYMSYLSVLYLSTSYTKPTPVLGISSAYISSSILVAFVLMTLYSLNFLYLDLRGKSTKEVI